MEYSVEARLTLETIRGELDMNDQQLMNAMSVLPLLERLGLVSWYDAAQCGLLIGTAENGPIDESLPLWIQNSGETDNVVAMLRMMCALRGINPDEDRVTTLEKRVAALEKELRQTKKKSSHGKKKASRRKEFSDEGATTEPEQQPSEATEELGEPEGRPEQPDEPTAELEGEPELTLKKKPGKKARTPEQIVAIYRDLEPSFTANEVEFEVSEEGKAAWYFDPRTNRPAIVYQACPEDLRKVRNLLKAVEKRTATKTA